MATAALGREDGLNVARVAGVRRPQQEGGGQADRGKTQEHRNLSLGSLARLPQVYDRPTARKRQFTQVEPWNCYPDVQCNSGYHQSDRKRDAPNSLVGVAVIGESVHVPRFRFD